MYLKEISHLSCQPIRQISARTAKTHEPITFQSANRKLDKWQTDRNNLDRITTWWTRVLSQTIHLSKWPITPEIATTPTSWWRILPNNIITIRLYIHFPMIIVCIRIKKIIIIVCTVTFILQYSWQMWIIFWENDPQSRKAGNTCLKNKNLSETGPE